LKRDTAWWGKEGRGDAGRDVHSTLPLQGELRYRLLPVPSSPPPAVTPLTIRLQRPPLHPIIMYGYCQHCLVGVGWVGGCEARCTLYAPSPRRVTVSAGASAFVTPSCCDTINHTITNALRPPLHPILRAIQLQRSVEERWDPSDSGATLPPRPAAVRSSHRSLR
jgi:hypothetical protein